MADTAKRSEKIVATVTMVITYEDLPDPRSLEELIQKAQELGGVDRADLTIHKTTTKSLI